jgi:tetratricopeptide (TPR) repeat protein
MDLRRRIFPMILPEPASGRLRPWKRRREADVPDVGKTGDVDQQASKVAIAHSGAGDIVVSVPGEPAVVHAPALQAGTGTRASSAVVRRTLPHDAREFTGRDDKVQAAMAVLDPSAADSTLVPVCAIDGMPGVGKTALAVHTARLLAPLFPDGQWFMRLHAHTPGHPPVDPDAALTALLRADGMDPREIPNDVEEKEIRWQERTAGRRILLLFDDAAGRAQVQPLLPGEGGAAVLLTSRHKIEAFTGLELSVLDSEEAEDLFTRLSGRADGVPDSVTELVTLAGRLPLAIGLLAGRLRNRPAWTAADLASELAAARDRSAAIGATDQPVSATFGLSYNQLPTGRQHFFRSLALHPGTDIDAYAAAALSGLRLDQSAAELDELYADHLIDEPSRGRYRFHDLISDYARALATADPATQREEALSRLSEYYLHTAQTAGRHLARYPPIDVIPVTTSRQFAPEIATRTQAAAWMEAERANLYSISEPRYSIAVANATADFLLTTGHWEEAASLHASALSTARHLGDVLGQAAALTNLGRIYRVREEHEAAIARHAQALQLFNSLGHRLGKAIALNDLGTAQHQARQHSAATASLIRSLELYGAMHNQLGEANVLINLGVVEYMTGKPTEAAATLTQALELSRIVGSQISQANAHYNLANVQNQIGDSAAAIANYTEARELFHAVGDLFGEALAMMTLAALEGQEGEYSAAIKNLSDALELSRPLGGKSEAGALSYLGRVQRQAGDYGVAKINLENAVAIYQITGEQHMHGHALCDLGAVYYETGEYELAMSELSRALEVFQAIGDISGEAECRNNIGDVFLATSMTAEAQRSYEQALTIARNDAYPIAEARALEGLGLANLENNHPIEAIRLLRQSQTIYEKLRSPNAIRVAGVLRQHGVDAPPNTEDQFEGL